jgi:putative restriction endonuclease
MNADHLHQYGAQPYTFRLLQRAAQLEEIAPEELEGPTAQRLRIVQTVARLSRKANFRQIVLSAYDNRCCVTRIQLKLVDAAHVVPVGAPESSDHITNALALAPTYHRAFDMGLIYLTDDYEMKTNPAKEAELRTLRLDGGLADFRRPLGRILLPQDRSQWPRVEFIRRARTLRSI